MQLRPSFNVSMTLVVIAIVSLPFVANAVSVFVGFSTVTVEDLTKIQEKTSDALLSFDVKLAGIGGGVLGTLLTFMFARYRSAPISHGQLALALATAASALSSLIFAFYAYRTVVWMTEQGAVNTRLLRYELQSDGQLLTLVSSGILFLILAWREFRRE